LLGYINFSDGRPDPRWQRQLDDAFAECGRDLLPNLLDALVSLQASGSAAFRDVQTARIVLELTQQVLVAYETFHADLLAHRRPEDRLHGFFLARVIECILQLRVTDPDLSADTVVERLNDFVGHRPIALLETRPRGEAYAHEKHRPVPLYLRGAGVAHNRYRSVLQRALEILEQAGEAMRAEAGFGFEQLDEIALDQRAYDHGHPVNRRPNYVFGEWDPHQIDNKGRYCRYVIRQVTLDALMDRVENSRELPSDQRLFEGAAVLAGTILMGTGVSGGGPGAYDSSVSLANLLPRIARYRDRFYEQLLERLQGPHAERLQTERETTRQPFGGARQHLNAFLAKHRAGQLQHRHLSLLFAEMGYPQGSREEANKIQAVSVRLLSELLGILSAGQVDCDLGRYARAAERLPQAEAILRRGIACGALVDPWNLLGFQGLFPLSAAREDAIRDPRVEELLGVVEGLFALYARVMSEATAAGDSALSERLHAAMDALAAWWDQYAGYEVSDVRRVHGGEASRSAANVAAALGAWRQRGETANDLAFWRERIDQFTSPKAFALVVEALLGRGDLRAALGLLASWLGSGIDLEDGNHSFHDLALRWVQAAARSDNAPESLLRFFAVLEANAEDWWEVPALTTPVEASAEEEEDDEDDSPFGAAYEGMVYRDSTRNDEGAVSDGAPTEPFDLEEQAEPLQRRLKFLATVGRAWQLAARTLGESAPEEWQTTARSHRERLLILLGDVHEHALPEPSGDYDSLVEYDRRRLLKEQLIYAIIATSLETTLAVAALHGVRGEDGSTPAPRWQRHALRLERALFAGDPEMARTELAQFLESFRGEPLLFTPLAEGLEGGDPRDILRVRVNQAVLRSLLTNLPRLGLLRETYDLLRTARGMEQSQPTDGRRGVTEFNHFFQIGYQAVLETVIRSARGWAPENNTDPVIVELLQRLTGPFVALWIEHSRTLQLSVLEGVQADTEWRSVAGFIQRYGRDLFHARFLTLGNLRGILHRGCAAYLEYLQQNPDPMRPVRLIADLEAGKVRREDAARRLETVLQAVVENYEEFKDYNTTTTQSDYGENLHVLLDFLRLKAQYERHAWQFRPLMLAHEVLARHGRASTSLRWEQTLTQFTRDLARQHLESLIRLERQHGIRLGTVTDRLGERFVKPLALDRLCALIEPCLNEARTVEEEAARPAFRRLQEELRHYTASPSGVGLDVPGWLRRVENERTKTQLGRKGKSGAGETVQRIAARDLSHDEVERQLIDWERPALPG
jgi:hypothetical protein